MPGFYLFFGLVILIATKHHLSKPIIFLEIGWRNLDGLGNLPLYNQA
ncbi:hypothetical protein STA3757_22800 [Stanieria sp. NIES-3757]|nr:hypothetical protein STA3757_22800 [Stanieria sp. NIES-3757]